MKPSPLSQLTASALLGLGVLAQGCSNDNGGSGGGGSTGAGGSSRARRAMPNKLGGDDVSAQHVLKNLYATGNGTGSYGSSGRGFTNNSNPASLSCSGCASWGNKAGDTGISDVSTTAPAGATAQKMIDAKRDADGNLPAITSL